MIWYLWAFVGALFDATYYLLVKKAVKDVNLYVLAGGTFLTSSLILFLISAVKGFPAIGTGFPAAVLITTSINALATLLVYRAFQRTDISLAHPMISFTPAFTLLTSLFILQEFPALLGIVGILLLVAGAYVLNISPPYRLLDPLRHIFSNKGAVYMLMVAFLSSITLNFDKLAVLNSDPFFSGAVINLLLGGFFALLSFNQVPNARQIYRHYLPQLLLLGTILSVIVITIHTALTMQIVPYVISIKRFSILFSVIGGQVFFHERQGKYRILGALIMIGGVVLIIFS